MEHQALFDSYLSNPAPLATLATRSQPPRPKKTPEKAPARNTNKRKRTKAACDDAMSDDSMSSAKATADYKKQRRRDQNRQAAQNSRDKKKRYLKNLQDQVALLSAQNTELMEKVEVLMAENSRLKANDNKLAKLEQPPTLEPQQHSVQSYQLPCQPSAVDTQNVKDEPAVCGVQPVFGLGGTPVDDGHCVHGGPAKIPAAERSFFHSAHTGAFGASQMCFPPIEVHNPPPTGWSHDGAYDTRSGTFGLSDFGFGNGSSSGCFEIELDVPAVVQDFTPGSPALTSAFSPLLNSQQGSGGLMHPISLEG